MLVVPVSKKIREVEYFRAFFFEKVTKKIHKVDSTLVIREPNITYHAQRSTEEDIELKELIIKNLREQQKEGGGRWTKDDEKRHVSLADKIVCPHYSFDNHTVHLTHTETWQSVPYFTLAHEFLHAVREETSPQKEMFDGYNQLQQMTTMMSGIIRKANGLAADSRVRISPELIEFFSEQNAIVLEDICKGEKAYAAVYEQAKEKNNQSGVISIAELERYHQHIGKNHQKELLRLMHQWYAIKDVDDMELNQRVVTAFDETLALGRYFIWGLHHDIKGNILPEIIPRVTTKDSLASDGVNKLYAFLTNALSLFDNASPYFISQTAISSNLGEIKKCWPKIFLQESGHLQRTYLDDIIKRTNRIKRDAIDKEEGVVWRKKQKDFYNRTMNEFLNMS